MVNHNVNHKTIELINSLKDKDKIKILFVCLGNICRSPAAEGVMRALVEERGIAGEWDIDSAGTGGWHVGDLPDRRMRIAARRRGLELDHICRQVTQDDFSEFDIIVAMDEGNYRDLRALSPSDEGDRRIHRICEWFSPLTRSRYDYIPDPYYEGAEGFELVLDLLSEACSNIIANPFNE